MQAVFDFMTAYGMWGMFVAAFLAGTVIPFSSEVVLLALLAAGGDPWQLLAVSTLGNTLGCMVNYWLGTLGREEWMDRLRGRNPAKFDRALGVARRYGYWSSLLAWLPYVGNVLSVLLGYLRLGFVRCMSLVCVGKGLRYLVIILIAKGML